MATDTLQADPALPPARYRAAVIAAIVGLLVSLAAFVFVARSEARLALDNFVSFARDQQAALQSGLSGYEDSVRALGLYFETTSEDVSFQQFLFFSNQLRASHPGIQALSWDPRVTHDERAAFEAKARATVTPDYQITDNALMGRPVRAADRPVYFPILYGTREPSFMKVFGSDLLAGPQAADYQQAIDVGQLFVRGPAPLVTVNGVPILGYLAILPVYRWNLPHDTIEQRRANIRGFAVGVFRVRETLSDVFKHIGAPPIGMDTYFFNPVGKENNRLLYWHPQFETAQTTPPKESELLASPHWLGTLKLVDRDIGVIFTPAEPLSGGFYDWQALATLLAGLLMTGMVTFYLVMTVRRTARLTAATNKLHEATVTLRREAEEHNAVNQQLMRRDDILDAVAASATDLLDQSDMGHAIPNVLERVATAAGVNYAYFLADRQLEQGRPVARERQEWHAYDLAPDFKKPILPYLDGRAAGLTRWAIQLGDGNPVSALVRSLPQTERTILESTGLKSVFVMPITVDGQWWGEIGIGDFTLEHAWADAESDALRTLAELIGTATARAHYVKALANANTIVENSPTILYRVAGEPALPMIYISHNIVKFGYDPAQFLAWPSFYRTLAHPEDQEKVQASLARAMEKDTESSSIEYRLRTGTGAYRWVENRFTPVRDSNGRLIEIEGIIIDITERKVAEEKIALLARTDSLTGLANRATFVERLHQAFAASKRGANPFSVLYIDLDRFKDVNDTLGHPAGDLLLKAASERLLANVRDTDVVARLGGDEFAVLQMEVPDPSNAGALAAKLHEALGVPYSIKSSQLHVTASIGVAPFLPETQGPDDMLAQADLALYRAKEEGRDQYRFHSDDLDHQVRERVALAEDLRSALGRNELELYYQPQVELASGNIVGMEALVRWHHPTKGLIGPNVFIPMAEKTGVIQALGHWVLDGACRQMKEWRDANIAPPVIAVNISLLQLKTGREFVRDVTSTLAKWELQPGDLEFDVTEFMLAQASLAQNDVLSELREMGIRIALDDFGTEYSSFDYLRTYHVNHLKIAQSFVERAVQDRDRAATIRAIIGLAHELGIEVIAEGVETEDQRALLVKIGSMTEGQGFYFSKPVPVDRANEILKKKKLEHVAAAE